jgi:hypothetical protein
MFIAAITKDFALSPSVSIKVQNSEFFFPASLASSSFSIPLIFADFVPFNYLFNLAFYFAFA